jgi:phytoene dehydrogenase-like protein
MVKLAADTEVVVVGSGPNGLAAAIEMARSGFRVRVLEASETVGGGTRTLELTLPGYRHDVCSAIHPLCAASPFYSQLPLNEHGLEWIYPPAALAHPLDDGSAVLLERDMLRTAGTLDTTDRKAYRHLMSPLKESWEALAVDLPAPISFPAHPFLMTRFGVHALRSSLGLARNAFRGERASA